MSHTTSIKAIKIVSIAALEAAVKELAASGIRVTMSKGGTPRAYYPNQQGMGKADYVVSLADAKYDIGLYKDKDGYEARTDFFGGSVEKVLGANARSPENAQQAKMGRLFQMYGVHAAMEQARRQGHSVRRVTQQDGTISLQITGSAL